MTSTSSADTVLSEASTTLLLVRHGHVEGVRPPRFRGRAEVELTGLGRRQIEITAARIAADWSPDIVLTSPRQRCIATGASIALCAGVPSRADDNLDDIDYGDWQLKTYSDIGELDPVGLRTWLDTPERIRFPRGETLQDLERRAQSSLAAISSEHSGRTVVLVGHDSINRVLLLSIMGAPLSSYWLWTQSPCGISEVVLAPAGRRIVRVNDTGHLSGIEQED